ncbi:MAG: hypothetical protein IJ365_01310 [Clostridia bacterium]|nr:hypothetical protein [Clostridia bacterium]
MKKTGKKFLMLMLTLVMIFVSAVPGFAEESTATITIASPTKIIAAKDSETVLRIPFTATLDGSTTGFAKAAKDSSGNAFYADQVWFDDSYMYFTNAINTSTTESKAITVTCTKDGATATQTITVYPYIEHDFSTYEAGTMLTTAITPATSSYAWSDGPVISSDKARVSEYSDGVNFLNPWTTPYVRLCFANVGYLVSDKGDVSVEIDLFKADSNDKSDLVGFRAKDATNTEYFFSFVKNADGSFNLYDKSAKTTLLKENVKVGDKVSVRIAINYATQKYRIYVDGSATPAVGDTAFTYTYTNSIVFTAPITRFAVYSGEEVTPLSYTINDEFEGWTDGAKYYNGSTESKPAGVNNIVVDTGNTGNESNAYFAKATKDGAAVLESYFAAASTANTQNVRYSGSGIGSKFLVDYKIFIDKNGIRVGASGAPATA